jgi:hypothetical protein
MQYKRAPSCAPDSQQDDPVTMLAFAVQASLVFIAALLATLLLSAIQFHFGVSPPVDWIEISGIQAGGGWLS